MLVRGNRRPWLMMAVWLIFGGVLLAVGTHLLRAEVTCGDAVMAPGDICEGTRDGEVTDRIAYEDALSDQRIGGYGLTGVGGIVVLGAFVLLRLARDRGKPAERQSSVDRGKVNESTPPATLRSDS